VERHVYHSRIVYDYISAFLLLLAVQEIYFVEATDEIDSRVYEKQHIPAHDTEIKGSHFIK
jgi:hypothetical protein